MQYLNIFFAIFIPTAAGTYFVSWVLGKDSAASFKEGYTFFEKVALGYGAGMGLVSLWIFALGMLRIPFSLAAFLSAPLAALFVFVFLTRGKIMPSKRASGEEGITLEEGFTLLTRHPSNRGEGDTLRGIWFYVSLFLGAWIFIKLAFVFSECFSKPFFSWDNIANWASAAKFFYYEKGFALDPANEHFFGSGYRPFLGHPLHTTLLNVWTSVWLGEFHEIYSKSWTFFYFASLLGLFYSALRKEMPSFYAVGAVFFLASSPIITYHGQDGYADLPLGYYGLASTVCLWKFLKNGGGKEDGKNTYRFILLAGVFSGMGVFVKNEGLFLLLGIFFSISLYSFVKRNFKAPVYFILPAAAFAAPWLLTKFIYGFGFGHGAGSGIELLKDPTIGAKASGLYWVSVPAALREWFLSANFNILFAVFFVALALGFKDALRSNVKYLLVIVASVLSMFLFVYLAIEYITVVQGSGIQRNTLTFAPIMAFSAALLVHRIIRGGKTLPRKNADTKGG